MSVDYSVYIGPAAVCTGPQYLGSEGDMLERFVDAGERVTPAENMCDPIIEVGHFFVPNVRFEAGLNLGWPPEVGRFHLPESSSISKFKYAFRDEINLMRELFNSVVIEVGVYVWAH